MRILMGSDLYFPHLLGGGEKRMHEIAKRLARKHEVHVVTRRFGRLPSFEVYGGVYIHRVFVPSAQVRLDSISDGISYMFASLEKGFKLGDFDLYAPQQFFPIFPLWWIAKTKKKPIVVTIHDVYGKTWTQKYGFKGSSMIAFEKLMIELPYTKVITVSVASKKKLVMMGVPSKKIEVIPNGVDLVTFNKVKTEKSEKPRIIYVGRLVKYKHVDDLIVAFSKLDLDAELYIVGDGQERVNLEVLVRKLGVDNKVTFTGFVDERRKIELLKSSHVLVLPSTTEGFGIVLVEAMAAGIPFVASEIEPLVEITDKKGGLFFRPCDSTDLANKLSSLLRNEELQKNLAKEGFKQALKYDWENISKKVEEIYMTVVSHE